MPITNIQFLLQKAEKLLAGSELIAKDELFEICALGLSRLVNDYDAFCGATPFCSEMDLHFFHELERLVAVLETPKDASWPTFSYFGEAQHRAFSLVEDMALIMRERKLRNGCKKCHPDEERIMAYFESCGNWPATCLAADLYYNQLPLAVKYETAAS